MARFVFSFFFNYDKLEQMTNLKLLDRNATQEKDMMPQSVLKSVKRQKQRTLLKTALARGDSSNVASGNK